MRTLPDSNRSRAVQWILVVIAGLATALVVTYYLRGYFFYRLLKPVVANAFHAIYYNSPTTWTDTKWRGTDVLKNPLDLWIFQEIVTETRPNVIVEAGTYHGGSALFLANLLDLDGRGTVVTIDIKDYAHKPRHPRIQYLLGSSTSPGIVAKVKGFIGPEDRVMVVLDSDHRKQHVLQELRAYCELVTKGCYMVVEDTNMNGHPVRRDFGPGPMEAVDQFLRENSSFVAERDREKFLMTFNPKGYLRRIH